MSRALVGLMDGKRTIAAAPPDPNFEDDVRLSVEDEEDGTTL